MYMGNRLGIILSAAIALFLNAQATAGERVLYRAIRIDAASQPGVYELYGTTGINEIGQVVGTATTSRGQQAFLWDRQGVLTLLDDLGGPGQQIASTGETVNNLGHLGGVASGTLGTEAFLWTPQAGMAGLGDLLGGSHYSWGLGMNDLNQIVGRSSGGSPVHQAPFLWDAETGMIDLGGLSSPPRNGTAWDINNAGHVVGWSTSPPGVNSAFIWEFEEGMRPLPSSPEGARPSEAFAINELGQVAGAAGAALSGSPPQLYPPQAFRWDAQGGTRLLGVLPGGTPQNTFNEAYGINDLGQVVGQNWLLGEPFGTDILEGFIWDETNGIRSLNDLLEARTPTEYFPNPPHKLVGGAFDINNAGEIVCGGRGGYYVLTPFVVGDMNCDGAVDAFDIEPFVTGLIDPSAYAARWPDCFADSAGDINQDGQFDAFDIEPFVQMLSGP
jgi:probable HAF family extracellular repeat protein